MQTPAAPFAASIYRGNDENKRLYASAIRHDGCSSIKKNQLTRRTANGRPTVETRKKATEDSFNHSRQSSTIEITEAIQTIKPSQKTTAFEISKGGKSTGDAAKRHMNRMGAVSVFNEVQKPGSSMQTVQDRIRNANISCDFTKGTTVKIGLANMLDKEYFNDRIRNGIGRSV